MITIAFSPQPYTEHRYEVQCTSLSPQPIIVPPPSPSSSVTAPDEASLPFNLHLREALPPTPPPANSTLTVPTWVSIAANGDTSCDEFSTTHSDAGRDESLSSSVDAHFLEFCPLPSQSPTCFTPVPYVQRGFGYRDNRPRGKGNRRRRTRAKT